MRIVLRKPRRKSVLRRKEENTPNAAQKSGKIRAEIEVIGFGNTKISDDLYMNKDQLQLFDKCMGSEKEETVWISKTLLMMGVLVMYYDALNYPQTRQLKIHDLSIVVGQKVEAAQ